MGKNRYYYDGNHNKRGYSSDSSMDDVTKVLVYGIGFILCISFWPIALLIGIVCLLFKGK